MFLQMPQPFALQQGQGHLQICTRVDKYLVLPHTEALPDQGFAQALPVLFGHGVCRQQQTPALIPGRGLAGVNGFGGLFNALDAAGTQCVVGASALGMCDQPVFFDQAVNGGADQSLVDLQRSQQADQTTQPNDATARINGVAEHGNDERTGLHAVLAAKAL